MNALDILKYGHLTVMGALEGLPQSEWETGGVCGVWSVKDIIGHLGAYELLLVDVLSSFTAAGGETPYLDRLFELGPERFNDDEAERRHNLPAQAVLDEYLQTQARNRELAAAVPAETWREVGLLPWYGSEYSLDDFIVYMYYGHKREHTAQVNVYKDWLKGVGVRLKNVD